jgi:hypothetical protein
MKTRRVTTIDVQEGKGKQAWEWAIKIATYHIENFDVEIDVLEQIYAPGKCIIWTQDYESLAAFEAWREKALADAGHQSLMTEAAEQGLFSFSSSREELLRIRSGS